MARWKFGFNSDDSAMVSSVDYSDNTHVDWEVTQYNDKEIFDEIKLDREILEGPGKKQSGWRKAFTIPDVAALDMLMRFGIDVHDPLFMHDPDNMKKLKYIIKTEYPHLLIST